MAPETRPRWLSIERQDLKRLFVFTGIGPPLGGLLFFAIGSLLPSAGLPYDWSNTLFAVFIALTPLVMIPAYILGFGPALITAVMSSLVARMTSRRWVRLVASPFLGFLSSAVGFGLFGFFSVESHADRASASFATVGVLIGAASSVICTLLVERPKTTSVQGTQLTPTFGEPPNADASGP